jgi:cytoskeletal protein CcmA (bactofilin family)
MGFFSKSGDSIQQNSRNGREVISSLISKDMRITGEVSFKGKARIDGIVEGNVKGEHLVLSENGKIQGDLQLISLICHGTVEGNIKAQQVTAHCTSSVHGNLAASSLTVEPGAKLNGEISASAPRKEESPPSVAAAAAAAKEEPPRPQPEKK